MIQGLGGGRSSLPLYPASHTATPRLSGRCHVAQPQRNLGDQMPCLVSAPILDPHISRPGVWLGLRAPSSCLEVPSLTLDMAGSPHFSLGGGGRAGPISIRHPENLGLELPTVPPHLRTGPVGLGPLLTLNVFWGRGSRIWGDVFIL